jgi:hypothetical protein
MNKVRSYVKSVKSRGSLACAFLVRAWQNLLCRWGWHDDAPSTWYNLHIDHPDGTTKVAGVRIVFTCKCCDHSIQGEHFETSADRLHWNASPERRRVTLRDWGNQ